MALNVFDLDDKSIDDYIDSIDMEKLLRQFDLVESNDFVDKTKSLTFKENRIKNPVLSNGKDLVKIMTKDYTDFKGNSFSVIASASTYGEAV
ncbi:hypothetical protein ACFQ44_04595 [Levilactobacillus lanxiensis]|uniref:Uncharacterized protein n=1 Tax=Levilactobacillus lanxiensis TaxID=2799568 RepID=A0ABW4D2Y4_9LACO|nr:hypothetical protein [Levilactobacillus lanxiensis]